MTALQVVQKIDGFIAQTILSANGDTAGSYMEALVDVRQYVLKLQTKLLKSDGEYFVQMAEKLREMWPAGEKDGKYPWRDSVENLVTRLQTLWITRNLKDYSLEMCLAVARRYLSKYEHDNKYMQTLKYFIMKQKKVVEPNGRIKYLTQSVFADMLEGKEAQDAYQNQIDELFANENWGEGTVR